MVEQAKTGSGSVATAMIQTPSVAPNLHYNAYPPPLARYEDVFANPKLFIDTLEKLHSAMGTKFMIPIIGGKDLDLHKLFVEATTRGGIEKILREKRWKEVTAAFQFPSTATNASFVLRKYYFSLLHHYEQIYFFRALGWTPMPHASLQSGHAVPIAVHGGFRTVPSPNQTARTMQPQPQLQLQGNAVADTLPQGVPSSLGSQVIGVIDGKFESGYLVTVTIGSEKLKGVLYQTAPITNSIGQPPQPPSNVINLSQVSNPIASDVAPQVRRRRRRRKKSEIKRRDPAHPKPNRSGYNFFFAEQHARLKPLYRGRDREISRIIGELWTKLQESEKVVYQEKAVSDKERYKREMEGYREKLRTGQVISDAVPIQQRLPLIPIVDAEMATVTTDAKDEAGRESSEMFENEDDDDDEEDEYCSMSGSEYEENAAAKDEETPNAATAIIQPSNANAQRSEEATSSMMPGSTQTGEQTEEMRVQEHGSDAVPGNQEDKTSVE